MWHLACCPFAEKMQSTFIIVIMMLNNVQNYLIVCVLTNANQK